MSREALEVIVRDAAREFMTTGLPTVMICEMGEFQAFITFLMDNSIPFAPVPKGCHPYMTPYLKFVVKGNEKFQVGEPEVEETEEDEQTDTGNTTGG